jgi:hypothetical protein
VPYVDGFFYTSLPLPGTTTVPIVCPRDRVVILRSFHLWCVRRTEYSCDVTRSSKSKQHDTAYQIVRSYFAVDIYSFFSRVLFVFFISGLPCIRSLALKSFTFTHCQLFRKKSRPANHPRCISTTHQGSIDPQSATTVATFNCFCL